MPEHASRPGNAAIATPLEFVNAGNEQRVSPSGQSALESLLGALVRSGVLQASDAATAARASTSASGKSDRLVREALHLRSVLKDIMGTIANSGDLSSGQIDALNDAVGQRRQHIRLDRGNGALCWVADAGDPVANALDSVALCAIALLTSAEEIARLRRCSGGCGTFFLDMTKNRSRRWCEMRECGNRAKARRHYARRRALRVLGDPASQADGVP